MAIPPRNKPYALKDRVEHAIDAFAAKAEPSPQDLEGVGMVAQIEMQLDMYRAQAQNMTTRELQAEEHESARLGDFLEATGAPRPHPLCDAHAIISGAHKGAAPLRALMAWKQIRIDDPDNGCWLPRDTEAKTKMPSWLRNAVPHSRIHRYNYYRWLRDQLTGPARSQGQDSIRGALRMVARRLQDGTQPPEVMARKGEGWPA